MLATGSKAETWCLLIHDQASLSFYARRWVSYNVSQHKNQKPGLQGPHVGGADDLASIILGAEYV